MCALTPVIKYSAKITVMNRGGFHEKSERLVDLVVARLQPDG